MSTYKIFTLWQKKTNGKNDLITLQAVQISFCSISIIES